MRTLCILTLAAFAALHAQDDARRLVPATPGRRLALIIGNRNYAWKPLVNPGNDARAVSSALAAAGFAASDVRLVLDAGRDDLRRAVRQFIESVKPGDLALVYYSGHGVEVKGNNYLLPVDLPADATEGYVQDEAVAAQRILRDLTEQGARVRVLILDACRDNPLRAAKSAGGGLAPMEGRGSLVVFATEAGRTASDTPGSDNSVFTRFLLEGLRTPGLSLDEAMKRVSRNVARETEEKQVPAIYGLLLEDVVLIAGAAVPNRFPAPPPVATPAVASPPIVSQGIAPSEDLDYMSAAIRSLQSAQDSSGKGTMGVGLWIRDPLTRKEFEFFSAFAASLKSCNARLVSLFDSGGSIQAKIKGSGLNVAFPEDEQDITKDRNVDAVFFLGFLGTATDDFSRRAAPAKLPLSTAWTWSAQMGKDLYAFPGSRRWAPSNEPKNQSGESPIVASSKYGRVGWYGNGTVADIVDFCASMITRTSGAGVQRFRAFTKY